MYNPHSSSMNDHSDYNDPFLSGITIEAVADTQQEDQCQLERLMGTGFDWEEAVKLMHLREHLYDNTEMQQRIIHNPRIQFARWLYENGEMTENLLLP